MSEHVHWTQYLLALLVLGGLLGLLGLFAMAIQRGWLLQQLTGLRGFRTDERRMKVTETLVIDPRRRVVILRIDDEEQVVLLGASDETVLKTGPARPEPVIAAGAVPSPIKGLGDFLSRNKDDA